MSLRKVSDGRGGTTKDIGLLNTMVIAYQTGFQSGLSGTSAPSFNTDIERKACDLGQCHAREADEFFTSALSANAATANDERDMEGNP